MKAVIPAAGFGTRFLPFTKSVPKELIPILDKPVIQYVVEEAAAGSGVKDAIAFALVDKTVYGIDLGCDFVPHGAMDKLYESHGLDAASIAGFVKEVLGK